MKNPLTYLKHILKDPINTIAEADARKKEIMPLLYGSAGVLAVGMILQIALNLDFMVIFSFIGLVGLGICAFLLFAIKKVKARFEALTCDKCNTLAVIKTPEEYANFVSYTVGKHIAEFEGINHPASNDGYVSRIRADARASVTVEIDLKCPHCGNVKRLNYFITPFRCTIAQDKVAVRDVELVKSRLESSIKEVVSDYNNPEKRQNIPYTIHSKKNPNYENRGKPQLVGNVRLQYNGVEITYRKDVEEMVEAFFCENQLDGTIVDPNKSKKAK